MPHYDITIIGSHQLYTHFKKKFKNKLKILFVDKFRNSIQTENGYIIVFNKEKKNIQISTDILLRIDT